MGRAEEQGGRYDGWMGGGREGGKAAGGGMEGMGHSELGFIGWMDRGKDG